jgi:hypothetical protein
MSIWDDWVLIVGAATACGAGVASVLEIARIIRASRWWRRRKRRTDRGPMV